MGKGTGGKSKKGAQTVRHKPKYQKQTVRTEANKVRRWKKYIDANPKDQQNVEILTKLLQKAKGGGR
jgi:hypothetical protein